MKKYNKKEYLEYVEKVKFLSGEHIMNMVPLAFKEWKKHQKLYDEEGKDEIAVMFRSMWSNF